MKYIIVFTILSVLLLSGCANQSDLSDTDKITTKETETKAEEKPAQKGTEPTIIQKSTPNTEVKQKEGIPIIQSKNESEETEIPVTKTKYSLGDYPNFLIQGGVFKGVLVIGDKAPSADVISITDIAMSLSYSVKNNGYPIAIGETKLASELNNIKSNNAILVGSPCINKGIADLFPKFDSSKCVGDYTYSGMPKNKGIILVVENNGNTQIIVTGYSQTNINHASKVLLNYKDYKLDGNLIIINEDGKVEGIEKTKTQVELAQEDCPKLDMFKPKQNLFDKDLYSIEWEENKVYDEWKIQCGLTCTSNCRKGKEEGENINYYYCGKNFLDEIKLKKTITDKEGNILEVITKNVIIVYDNNFNYLQNICT